jgi:hypothetical protein
MSPRTVTLSPKAALRIALGLPDVPVSRRICAGDWMELRVGDRVRERDGRHVGRVEAIHNSALVKVRWEGTGWFSELELGELEKESRR